VKSWLVDTGPLVAYLDAHDHSHTEVVRAWESFSGQLYTTSAVITETMHFVSTATDGASILAELVDTSSMEVYDLTQPPELREAAALMKQYSDTPMDFADATLLLLAEAIKVHNILTLDRRGFTVFRTRDNRPLQNVFDAAI